VRSIGTALTAFKTGRTASSLAWGDSKVALPLRVHRRDAPLQQALSCAVSVAKYYHYYHYYYSGLSAKAHEHAPPGVSVAVERGRARSL
jgi:hypothetical protein